MKRCDIMLQSQDDSRLQDNTSDGHEKQKVQVPDFLSLSVADSNAGVVGHTFSNKKRRIGRKGRYFKKGTRGEVKIGTELFANVWRRESEDPPVVESSPDVIDLTTPTEERAPPVWVSGLKHEVVKITDDGTAPVVGTTSKHKGAIVVEDWRQLDQPSGSLSGNTKFVDLTSIESKDKKKKKKKRISKVPFYCMACHLKCSSEKCLTEHMNGFRHKKRMKQLQTLSPKQSTRVNLTVGKERALLRENKQPVQKFQSVVDRKRSLMETLYERTVVKLNYKQECNIKKILSFLKDDACSNIGESRTSTQMLPKSGKIATSSSCVSDPEVASVSRDFPTSFPANSSTSMSNQLEPISRTPRIPACQAWLESHSAVTTESCESDPPAIDVIDLTEEEEELHIPTVAELLEYSRYEVDLTVEEEKEDILIDLTGDDEEEEEEEQVTGSGPEVCPGGTVLDESLLEEFRQKQQTEEYKKMLRFRENLPTYKMKQEILSKIHENQCVVISGETGCGKTTQIPQFILDDFLERNCGSQCRIVCTQPRRISAVSVAERVSSERAEDCGISCGYIIRLERELPRKHGSITFCTTGILLKFLESDCHLKKVTHLIIDEIHERDLLSDFLLIILKDIMTQRTDLKIILMSATLNAESFSKYFYNCPMLHIPGFTHPVKEFLLEEIINLLGYKPSHDMLLKDPRKKVYHGTPAEQQEKRNQEEAWFRSLEGHYSQQTINTLRFLKTEKVDLKLVVQLVHYITAVKPDGAILVFVSGWDEIGKLRNMLTADIFGSGRFRIVPLHSRMPTYEQKMAFERPPPGVRKVVIATNIAETSITIDDIVYVINCGKVKVKDFQPERNLLTLDPQWVSKANAKQRKGRAGRLRPGECYHLCTGLKETELPEYLPPEMLRTRLEELCLHIKFLKLGKIEPFVSKAMNPPSAEALHRAIITLQTLNALDEDENLLPLGYHLARMPVDPHVGKMILFGAIFSCLDPILIVAASLSFKDAFFVPMGGEEQASHMRKVLGGDCRSDHLLLIEAFCGWETSLISGMNRQYCSEFLLVEHTLMQQKAMKDQLAALLSDLGFIDNQDPKNSACNINSGNDAVIKAVICAGLYPNVARIKNPKSPHNYLRPVMLVTPEDKSAQVHPKSINARETVFQSKWIIYHKKLRTSAVYVHDCSMISPFCLLFFGGHVKLFKERGEDCISVDDWIAFRTSSQTAHMVKELKQQLDSVLDKKITCPSVTEWDPGSKEGALFGAIIDLLKYEDEEMKGGYYMLDA